MESSIGIVGAGVSGLHLGLYLRQHDVPVTIYAERSPDEVRASRLLNTVGHHHHTLERERALGVHHWDAAGVRLLLPSPRDPHARTGR